MTAALTDARRRRFGDALDAAMREARLNAREVAEHVGLTDDAVRKWVAGRSQPDHPDVVFAVEQLLALGPGDLSHHLGYVPVQSVSVLAAIDADASLSDRDRKVLRTTYRALRS